MHELNLSAEQLVEKLLLLPNELGLCMLDSCGVSYLNSHLLVAGICPQEIIEIKNETAEKTLEIIGKKLSQPNLSSILTIPYDFGLKLNNIKSRHQNLNEPDFFAALFDVLIIHNYDNRKTYLIGNDEKFDCIENLLLKSSTFVPKQTLKSKIISNFTRSNYISAIENIQEFIRCGDTYQTNLTQQISADLPNNLTPEIIFRQLRKSHPAPFASFIRRKNDVVISASPERFFKVENGKILTSPIKGTRPRGENIEKDTELKKELLNSEKDLAENIMIVDLLRNDLGRICEFGSVEVEKLCDLEEHPSLFHLVSTISGKLNSNTSFTDILRATFPCGSITGAPKIRTMQIIDDIETNSRGLSMGAIGIADSGFLSEHLGNHKTQDYFDFNVAIRTMTIRGKEAIFNVGGGIVIDSIPEDEYEETLTKAKALLNSIGANKL